MKRDWKDEGVSPVIATILMVAITVVLASVLYVMVIGMGTSQPKAQVPLGLNQQQRNSTSITVFISSAPTSSLIWHSSISVTHNGIPIPANATIYSGNASLVGTYINDRWDLDSNDTPYQTGMILIIKTSAITHGDIITISGIGFGPSIVPVD